MNIPLLTTHFFHPLIAVVVGIAKIEFFHYTATVQRTFFYFFQNYFIVLIYRYLHTRFWCLEQDF